MRKLRIKVGLAEKGLNLYHNTFFIPEDIEIILLKARLEQTEKTLQRLIGKWRKYIEKF